MQHPAVGITGYAAITARGDFSSRGESTFANGINSVQENSAPKTIPNFDIKNYPLSKKTYLDRCSALALAASSMALRDADVLLPPKSPEKIGIILGTHWGCVDTMKRFWEGIEQKGARLAKPLLFSHSYYNSPVSLCAIEFGLQGYHNTVCSGSTGGLEAVQLGYDAICAGHADAMLCGGVDALSKNRQQLSPDTDAAEAAVFVVLEKSTFARERGAKVLLEIDSGKVLLSEQNGIAKKWGNCGAATSLLGLLEKYF